MAIKYWEQNETIEETNESHQILVDYATSTLQVEKMSVFRFLTTSVKIYIRNLHIDLSVLKSVVVVVFFYSPSNTKKTSKMKSWICEFHSLFSLLLRKVYIYDVQYAFRAKTRFEQNSVCFFFSPLFTLSLTHSLSISSILSISFQIHLNSMFALILLYPRIYWTEHMQM